MNTFAEETSTGHFSLLPLYLKQIERFFFCMLTLYNWSLTCTFSDQNSAEGNAHEMTKAKHIIIDNLHYRLSGRWLSASL